MTFPNKQIYNKRITERDSSSKEDPAESKFIVVEAPPELIDDQNLYDQPPFKEVVDSAVAKTGLEESKVRQILAKFCWWCPIGRLGDIIENFSQDKIDEWRSDPEWSDDRENRKIASYCRRVFGTDQDYLGIAITLFVGLSDYPLWRNYISQFQALSGHEGFYRSDGTYRKTPKFPYLPTPSYANWVQRKLKTEGRQILFGIEEIFPQDLSGQPLLPQITSRKKAPTRKWAILKASELIREKR